MAPTGSQPLLTARDVHVRYHTKRATVHAVRGVNLTIRRGETLGLVGESGCGKSTFARALAQLPAPSAGRVDLEGSELTALRGRRLRQVRRRIQIVFQDPTSSLNPRRRVEDIVAEPATVWHELGRPNIDDLLEKVGLSPSLKGSRPHQLSGGQCQRVSIARALAMQPDLLICDEPVSGLDVSVQAQVVNLLEDLKRDLGLTILFVSHDLAVVKNISDRVAVMYVGAICELGDATDLLARPAHPYTAALASAVPVPDPDHPLDNTPDLLDEDASTVPQTGCRYRPRCSRAQDRCATDEPMMQSVGEGHEVACHFPLLIGPNQSNAHGERAAIQA